MILRTLAEALVIFATVAKADTFSANSYIKQNKTEPYKSKGLTPAVLKPIEGVSTQIIAQNGKACMPIVIPPNSVYYKQVADLLKEYLDQATGADFQIISSIPERNAIFVGPVDCPELKLIAVKAGRLAAENFIVESFTKGIALIGNDHDRAFNLTSPLSVNNLQDASGMRLCSRGTMYAAIDFLERFVGIRWYYFGPLNTIIPDLKATTLQMPPVAYQDGPVFPARCSGYGRWVAPLSYKFTPEKYQITDYKRYFWERNLLRSGASFAAAPNHTDCFWHEFYANKPELFALRADGSRMAGGTGREMYSSQRCYANPEGLKEHLKVIDEYIKTGKEKRKFTDRLECLPNDKFIYWVPNDGFMGCECPECLKLTDRNAAPDSVHSRLVWDYIVRLANEIKTKWPERKLCVLAYATFATVPSGVKIPDNVVVTACFSNDIPVCLMKEPKYRQINQQKLDELYNRSGKIILWMYYPHMLYWSNKLTMPYFSPHVQAEYLKTNRNKIYGAYLNGEQFADGLNNQAVYLYLKLLWNPDLDVDEYLAEYIALMYGPAAQEMKQYYDLTIGSWENTRWSQLPSLNYNLGSIIPAKLYWNETYPRNIREQLHKILQNALTRTQPGSIYYDRVKFMIDANTPFFEEGKFADETVKPVLNCTSASPAIDGLVTEWNSVKPEELRTWMGKPAEQKTEIFTAFDKNNIYIAGKVYESDSMSLPANKNDIFKHDALEIYLCSEQPGFAEAGIASSEQFHQIVINGKGDMVVYYKDRQKMRAEPLKKDFTAQYAVKPMGNGFQFELAIPYKSLNAVTPVSGKTQWFANFYRSRPRGENQGYQAWSPTMGKPFFNIPAFGIIRFVDQPLFAIDFNSCAKKVFRNDKEGDKLITAIEIKDGRIVFSAKATPGLKKDCWAYVDLYKITVFQLTQPVVVEWAFRYKGKGLKSVYLSVKESAESGTGKRDQVMYRYHSQSSAQEDVNTEWIKGKLLISKEKNHMNNISFWDFETITYPNADFILEVDYIKVYPQ